jgi:hypothetical protein
MAISYFFETKENFLRVKSIGFDEDLNEVNAYGLAVVSVAISYDSTRILCDETELEYTLGTVDTFESAKVISHAAPKIARIAIACKPCHFQDAAFWETVAVNRGLTVRVFRTLAEAEDWVMRDGG